LAEFVIKCVWGTPRRPALGVNITEAIRAYISTQTLTAWSSLIEFMAHCSSKEDSGECTA